MHSFRKLLAGNPMWPLALTEILSSQVTSAKGIPFPDLRRAIFTKLKFGVVVLPKPE